MPSQVSVGLGPHRPSSYADSRSHPLPPPTSRSGVVGWDAIVKGVTMSRVATKDSTTVRGTSGVIGVESTRLRDANEFVRCVPTVCLLSCVFTPSTKGVGVVDARAARAAEEAAIAAAAARSKPITKSKQSKPPVPPVKPQQTPPPHSTLRCTFVSWRDAGYWCQWDDNDSHMDEEEGHGDVDRAETNPHASFNSSVYSAIPRSDAPVRGNAFGNAFSGGGLGDSFYITTRNEVNMGGGNAGRGRSFSGRGLGDSRDSADDFRGAPLDSPHLPHNLSTRSADYSIPHVPHTHNLSTRSVDSSMGGSVINHLTAPPDPFSHIDLEKRLMVGVLALDQAGNLLTWLGRDLQAASLTHHVETLTRSAKLGDGHKRDEHDDQRSRQSYQQSETGEEEEGDRRVQRSARRHSWHLPLPAAALWTSTAPTPSPSSTPPLLPSPSSLVSSPPVVNSPVGPSFALFAVAALAIDSKPNIPNKAPKTRRIGPYLRAGGGLLLVLSMADDPSLSFLTTNHREDVGTSHRPEQGGGGQERVFPLLPCERPLQVEWQWLPSSSFSSSSSTSTAVALLGVLTNQRVLILAASSHGLQPLNAHTHTHAHRSHHNAPSPLHSHPRPQPVSWSTMRCGRWDDPASSIAWMGAALLYTTRSGAIQCLLPAPPLPLRSTPSTATSSRASHSRFIDHGGYSRSADQCVALALGFLPALASIIKSHNNRFNNIDKLTHGGKATHSGGGSTSMVDMSANGGMDNTDLCSGRLCSLPRDMTAAGGLALLAVAQDRLLLVHCSNCSIPIPESVPGSVPWFNTPLSFSSRPCNPVEPLMLGWLALGALQLFPQSNRASEVGAGTAEVEHTKATALVSDAAIETALVALAASYLAPRTEPSSGASSGVITEGKGKGKGARSHGLASDAAVSHKYPQGQPLMRMDACRCPPPPPLLVLFISTL